jgi:hypothetical protein
MEVVLRKTFALAVLSLYALLFHTQTVSAQTFTLSSFSVSPDTIVSPSNQTLTYSVSITPPSVNQNVLVQVTDQLGFCGADLIIGPGQSSASTTNTCAGFVLQDTSDTLTASYTDGNGHVSSLQQTITLQANRPTISLDSSSLTFNVSTPAQATILATLNGSVNINLRSADNTVSGDVVVNGNSLSGDGSATG